jgi:hypothetical protein
MPLNPHDAAAFDRDVARERRAARAVDHGSAHDFQIEHASPIRVVGALTM